MKPLPKKFNWGDVGIGLAAAGATGAAGLLTTAVVTRREQDVGLKDAWPVLLPTVGAGVLGYFLRRECPDFAPPVEMPEQPRLVTAPRPPTLLGYGAVASSQSGTVNGVTRFQTDITELEEARLSRDEANWIIAAKDALISLGYLDMDDVDSSITGSFHQAVSDFQRDNGLTATGWIDLETAGALTGASGKLLSTITPHGVGYETHNPPVEKTNWALWLGGLGVAAVGTTAIVLGVASRKKDK